MTQQQSDSRSPTPPIDVLSEHHIGPQEPPDNGIGDVDFGASMCLDDIAHLSAESLHEDYDDSEKSQFSLHQPSKEHRRRSLELSCMNLKIDLAESCTTLDAVRQELTSSRTEKNALSEEVASLQSQLRETQALAKYQDELIHHLRKNTKEWTLERVNLRVQVESLQAKVDRYKTERRRFADESARSTAEAKEMRDVVHFLRDYAEKLLFEKEESERRLASILYGEEREENQDSVSLSRSKTPPSPLGARKIWFGRSLSRDNSFRSRTKPEENNQEEDVTLSCSFQNKLDSTSGVNGVGNDRNYFQNNDDTSSHETMKQDLFEDFHETESTSSNSVLSALASSPKLIPHWNNWIALNLKTLDQGNLEEHNEECSKRNITQRIRKSWLIRIKNKDALAAEVAHGIEVNEEEKGTKKTPGEIGCDLSSRHAEVIVDDESTLGSERSGMSRLSSSDLLSINHEAPRQRHQSASLLGSKPASIARSA